MRGEVACFLWWLYLEIHFLFNKNRKNKLRPVIIVIHLILCNLKRDRSKFLFLTCIGMKIKMVVLALLVSESPFPLNLGISYCVFENLHFYLYDYMCISYFSILWDGFLSHFYPIQYLYEACYLILNQYKYKNIHNRLTKKNSKYTFCWDGFKNFPLIGIYSRAKNSRGDPPGWPC